uniref:Uncharacterized protein n=1 Tax=Anguilla anguilla TaxID=7936 RepID=A0A0E9WAC8_ANGAN
MFSTALHLDQFTGGKKHLRHRTKIKHPSVKVTNAIFAPQNNKQAPFIVPFRQHFWPHQQTEWPKTLLTAHQ